MTFCCFTSQIQVNNIQAVVPALMKNIEPQEVLIKNWIDNPLRLIRPLPFHARGGLSFRRSSSESSLFR